MRANAGVDKVRNSTGRALAGIFLVVAIAGCGESPASPSPSPSPSVSRTVSPIPTLAATPTPTPTPTPSFVATGSMHEGRMNATATLLQNGKVLIAGGSPESSVDSSAVTDSAELYDPSTGKFTSTGSMVTGRMSATATLLSDGRVLIAGGWGCLTKACNPEPAGHEEGYLKSAELYDPGTGKSTSTGPMERLYDSATLLPDGRVLMLGAEQSVAAYDPTSGNFTLIGTLLNDYDTAIATPIAGGQVLIVGYKSPGQGPSDLALYAAELFDLASGRSSPLTIPLPAGGSAGPGVAAAVALTKEGGVLVCLDNNLVTYDPATRSFTQTGTFSVPSQWNGATTTLLPGDRFLFTGGQTDLGAETTDMAALYDPTNGFQMIGSMIHRRSGQTATLLPDGTILIAGGPSDTVGESTASAELLRL